MNDLVVKNVDVLGDTIVAAKDKDGVVWAGVSYFCKALGMSDKQRDNQVAKVQKDKTLKRGTLKFREGVFDRDNEAVGIRIDFIPLWLAKIPVTEKMEQDHPELADKLLQYQLQAKDILAAAFLPWVDGSKASNNEIPLRFYKNGKWYILTIGEEVYSLKADEAKQISNAVSAMLKNDVPCVIEVVKSMIANLKREDCQLNAAIECMVKRSLPVEKCAEQ